MEINSMQFIEELMYQEWESFAEFAYQEFKRIGRGAIFIDFNEFKITTGPNGEQSFEVDQYKYFSINNKDFGGQDVHDKIIAYDPNTQVVFVFRLRMPPVGKQGDFDLAPTVTFMGSPNDKPSPKEIYKRKHKKKK